MPETDPLPDDDVLAGELALGLLEGIELAEAKRRQIAEPEFARRVELWRDHFAVLALQTAEHEPPAALAKRVAEAVRREQTGPVVAAMSALRKVRQWRAAAAAGGGIAAALALALLWPAPPQQPPSAAPMLVAALDLAETHQTLLASLDAAGHVRIAGQFAVPKARNAQLWLIIGKSPPRSLGLLRAGADKRLLADGGAKQSAIVPGNTLAISIEPIGGSPTGLPTGPVIASGVIQKI